MNFCLLMNFNEFLSGIHSMNSLTIFIILKRVSRGAAHAAKSLRWSVKQITEIPY